MKIMLCWQCNYALNDICDYEWSTCPLNEEIKVIEEYEVGDDSELKGEK